MKYSIATILLIIVSTFHPALVQTASAATSCDVYLTACQTQPSLTGKLLRDDWNGSSHNEAVCWQRARDYFSWCGNSPSQWVQSYFLMDGVQKSRSSAPSNYLEKLDGLLFLFPVFKQFPDVVNAAYQNLPRDWNDLITRYEMGGAGQVTPATAFGGNASASGSALYLIPPKSLADIAKMIFQVNLNPSLTWYLNYRVGLLNAMSAGGRVQIQILVSGDALVIGEESWRVLYTQVISAGTSQQISIPLGTWAMRSHLSVAIQVQKLDGAAGQPMVVIDGLNIAPGIARPPLGMDRSNLVWEDDLSKREQDIDGSSRLGAKWFRDGFFLPHHGTSDFVDIVRRVKSKGMKMLALVTQSPEDYDRGWNAYVYGGSQFQAVCGWSAGSLKLSEINLQKFAQRLRLQLDAIKNAGLSIDAFEIGNELDWVCFNGDVPFGREPTETDLAIAVQGYAWFLHTAVQVIRDPQYFPLSKIVTFGMANVPPNFRSGYHFADAAAFVARLRNVNGFNYLSLVDAYGTHLYPDASLIGDLYERNGRNQLQRNVASLGNDKPYWITEWGYPTTLYPDSLSRSKAMLEFLDMVSSQYNTQLGPQFFYAYSSPQEIVNGRHAFGLIDLMGNWLDEVYLFASRYRFN